MIQASAKNLVNSS